MSRRPEDRSLRVALFPSAFWPSFGGVEEMTRQVAHELRRRGHRVLVVANRWPRSLPIHERYQGIDVYRPALRVPGGSPRAKLNARLTGGLVRRQVARELRRFGVDLVHVICVSTGNGRYARHVAGRLDVPLVVTVQGELSMDATGLYGRSALARRTLRELLDAADAATGCSRQVVDELAAFYGRPLPDGGRVIYNGIRRADFGGAPTNGDRPYLLGIGRHVPQKGFDVLLRAYRRLLGRACGREVPDLKLAGDGPEHAALRRLAGELDLDDRVEFAGRVDRGEAVALLKGAKAVVLPSRHEPFGIVNLEAMAAGVPLVATAVGGVPEFVRDDVNGLLVPPDDPPALAEALTRLLADAALGRRLADAGRRTAAGFDWAVLTDQYLGVYGDLLENGGRRLRQHGGR